MSISAVPWDDRLTLKDRAPIPILACNREEAFIQINTVNDVFELTGRFSSMLTSRGIIY